MKRDTVGTWLFTPEDDAALRARIQRCLMLADEKAEWLAFCDEIDKARARMTAGLCTDAIVIVRGSDGVEFPRIKLVRDDRGLDPCQNPTE